MARSGWSSAQLESSRGRGLILATRRGGTRTLFAATATGAVVVFVFLSVILPAPAGTPAHDAIRFNLAIFVPYMALALALGRHYGVAMLDRRLEWLKAGREPDEREQRATLRLPFDQMLLSAVGWAGAALVFGSINLRYSGEFGFRVATTILMGGLATCALFYLLGERSLRDIAARALATGPPLRPVAPGVVARSVIAWTLATAVPVGGIGLVALGVISGDTPANTATAWSIVFLVVATVGVGILTTIAAARSVAEPIRSVRAGLARIEAGEADVEVPVYDASEVGLLQAGFNQMAAGLRERERLRDLFGRHVGEDVAREALAGEIKLGGELRDAAVLFVDIVGSTRMAGETAPEQVVELLNEFFAVVVDVIESHGGWVNKFEGDAALCIFGVPTSDERCAANALAAARDLTSRLGRDGLPAAGIGVSAGTVVAGNVGAPHRLEYTVIGDPVNEAARLTELAKDEPHRALASGAALRAAGDGEAAHWRLGEAVQLRGRAETTRLARPAAGME
ncbi:MAG: adenylate/guanylate cyclase with integral rane sensor [Ramlibacter sp.]|nr:adenylate/guanylate cyclase with integral rane sensor [Ramlibacter sp.]